jgi:hypothetical protein
MSISAKSYADPEQVKGLVAMYAQVYKMLYPAWEMESQMALAEAVAAFEVDVAKLLLTVDHSTTDVTVCASKLR